MVRGNRVHILQTDDAPLNLREQRSFVVLEQFGTFHFGWNKWWFVDSKLVQEVRDDTSHWEAYSLEACVVHVVDRCDHSLGKSASSYRGSKLGG